MEGGRKEEWKQERKQQTNKIINKQTGKDMSSNLSQMYYCGSGLPLQLNLYARVDFLVMYMSP